jgi:RNA polymerase sigma factor (sigma-70 family)
MEDLSNQPVDNEVERDKATRAAWEARGHFEHYTSCEPESTQAREALAAAQSAFSRFIILTQEQLTRSALRRTDGDHDAVSDIVQETYLAAWKYLPSFRGDGNVVAWLHHTMYNELSTYYKKEAKYVLGRNDDLGAQFETLPNPTTTVDDLEEHLEYLDHKEIMDKLEVVMREHLSLKARARLIGKYVLELPHKALVQHFDDPSVNASKIGVHRALLKLRVHKDEIKTTSSNNPSTG